ncbi:MAG: hypothetical protein RLZZ244_2674, partial [Verrucomicrobiota bacterium]
TVPSIPENDLSMMKAPLPNLQLFAAALFLSTAPSARAEAGVPSAQKPLKAGNAVSAEALSPEAQRALFQVPEGFEIELVASEETGLPKPTMTVFDDSGRLWSASATAYPSDNDPKIWKTAGNDKVVVFDTPLRRGPQTPRVFADGLVMPMSVLPHGRGAYVALGPELVFMDDQDGDGKADARRVLLSGFGIQDTHTLPHGLTLMPGRRIAFSQGCLNSGTIQDARGVQIPFHRTLVATFAKDGTDVNILSAGFNNIWAWVHTRLGRVFIHEANDFGYGVVPFEEDSSFPSFSDGKLHPRSPVHPPTASNLKLGGTGLCGMALCDDRRGSFPAPWHGLFYVANPIVGKVQAVHGALSENGVWSFESRGDLVACADPMFRPIALTFGPDGCLYITDWYNRIISHNEVRRDHPSRDHAHGRIWRVRHRDQPAFQPLDLAAVATAELPRHLNADRTWEMRAAWHQIGLRQDRQILPELARMTGDRELPVEARIHALWSLEELGYFDPVLWKRLLEDASSDLRREAVRAMTSLRVPEAEAFALLQALKNESQWGVRYAVLRFFRKAEGPVYPQHVAWLRQWSEQPAPTQKVQAWKGPYYALGGAYERAFQDFLLSLAATKSSAYQRTVARWEKVLQTEPEPVPSRVEAVRTRALRVQRLLGSVKPDAGKPLFEAACLACHSAGGKGVGFAPPLDGSQNRDVEALAHSVLAPSEAVEDVFRMYRVEKKDGTSVEGFRRAEDSRGITLVLMGGAELLVPPSEIRDAGYIRGKSVMPELAGGLTDEQVAELIAYLRSLP